MLINIRNIVEIIKTGHRLPRDSGRSRCRIAKSQTNLLYRSLHTPKYHCGIFETVIRFASGFSTRKRFVYSFQAKKTAADRATLEPANNKGSKFPFRLCRPFHAKAQV